VADSSYPATEFSSIDELCEKIDHATKGWDTCWFRGAKTPTYGLLPKLFREEELAKREGYIGVEFRRRGRSQLKEIRTPFEWLCAMQHYGLPTRLLDWSESLSVALYFTTRPIGPDLVAPTIWVLNPFELYSLTDQSEIVPLGTDERVLANADITFGDNWTDTHGQVTRYPLPVVPDFLFDRLAIQNGTFTIHGSDKRPIEDIIPVERRAMLLKFEAKRALVPAIYNCLDLIRPSSDSLFPDLEGIEDYII
jgi:FRG domain